MPRPPAALPPTAGRSAASPIVSLEVMLPPDDRTSPFIHRLPLIGIDDPRPGVCLLFDRSSDRAIRALWEQLESLGVPSLHPHTHGRHVPHVSYAVLRSWDLARVSAALRGLGAGEPARPQVRWDR